MDKVKIVAIEYENEKPLRVLDVETLNDKQVSQLKQQASFNQVEKERLANVEKERFIVEQSDLYNRFIVSCYLNAYALFTNLVEMGKAETTKEFEDMFDNFMKGGEFVKELMPQKYQEILGRLL